MVWLIGFGVTVSEISSVEVSKNCRVSKRYQNPVFSKVDILLMIAQNQMTHSIFWKSYLKSFRRIWIFCPNCDWFLAVNNRKCKKWAIFDMLLAITPGVNIITRQMTPIFFIYSFELNPLLYFIFGFQDLQNSVPGVPLCIMFSSVK